MKIVNLMPHDLTLIDPATGKIVLDQRSAGLVRVSQTCITIGSIDLDSHSVPVVEYDYQGLVGLPPKVNDTAYVVSLIAAQAAAKQHPDRDDIYIPADLVRDNDGNIIGAYSLAVV